MQRERGNQVPEGDLGQKEEGGGRSENVSKDPGKREASRSTQSKQPYRIQERPTQARQAPYEKTKNETKRSRDLQRKRGRGSNAGGRENTRRESEDTITGAKIPERGG